MIYQDIEIWRGNNARVIGFNFPWDLTGSIVRMKITWPTASAPILKSTEDGGLAVTTETIEGISTKVVWFAPTIEESREIGNRATYEIERLVGSEQKTYVAGKLIVAGGNNVD